MSANHLKIIFLLLSLSCLTARSQIQLTDSAVYTPLFRLLATASTYGLNEKDYQYQFISGVKSGNWKPENREDSLRMNLLLTDAALHFFSDVSFGNSKMPLGYEGIKVPKRKINLDEIVPIMKINDTGAASSIEPRNAGYRSLKATLNELKDSNDSRLNSKKRFELAAAMNFARKLDVLMIDSVVVIVNIPSATLMVYDHGRITLESKVIVGKPSTRTPTLSSRITEVVLFPYWVVPRKIATLELLPLIQLNTKYLENNGFQVLNEKWQVIDPSTVPWKNLSPSNFPYTLRQSTGCDNSLGLIKLNFLSPYSVYLHDTPWKSLFSFKRRYFSHGCIRVQKAAELAKIILGDKAEIIDTLNNQKLQDHLLPVNLAASRVVPVVVIYSTAWFDGTGKILYSDDIYRRLPKSLQITK